MKKYLSTDFVVMCTSKDHGELPLHLRVKSMQEAMQLADQEKKRLKNEDVFVIECVEHLVYEAV